MIGEMMNMSTLLLTAVLAFLVKELLSIFIFTPWASFNDLRGKIFEVLTKYSKEYQSPSYFVKTKAEAEDMAYRRQNDQRHYSHIDPFTPPEHRSKVNEMEKHDNLQLSSTYEKISLEIREVASQIYGFIPNRYPVLCWLPSKKDICEIAQNVMIISDFYNFSGEMDDDEYTQKISTAEEKIKKLLPDEMDIIVSKTNETDD